MRSTKKVSSNFKRLAAVVAGAVLLSAAQAQATLMLNIYENGSPLASISDGGAGDNAAASGAITYSSPSDANFQFSVDIATSNSPGTTNNALNITSFTARNFAAGVQNLTLVLSDVGFVAAGNSLQSTVAGQFNAATVGDTVSFQSFADSSNAQQTTIAPLGSATPSPLQSFTKTNSSLGVESFSGPTTMTPFVPPVSGSFSMSSVSAFNLSPGASVQFNGGSLVAVDSSGAPEPASLALLSIGGLTFLGSRRRRV